VKKKLIKIALTGRTNSGKSSLFNSLLGKKISIINKKINTTNDLITGIINIQETQIILYDTPGTNYLSKKISFNKNFRSNIWNAIDHSDLIMYLVDSKKFNLTNTINDLIKIQETNKKIIFVFNKIDLIDSKIIIPFIEQINKTLIIDSFFNISVKKNKGINNLIKYLKTKSNFKNWTYKKDQFTDKDNIFITNECTRNSILQFLHKEIPYKLIVRNILYKILKNKDIKIKQSIDLDNIRYKRIVIGKKGETIKRIREKSQNDISKILNMKVHLYLKINKIND